MPISSRTGTTALGRERVEPTGHEAASEPDLFPSLDGVRLGGGRPAVQRHSSARSRGHRGVVFKCDMRFEGRLRRLGQRYCRLTA